MDWLLYERSRAYLQVSGRDAVIGADIYSLYSLLRRCTGVLYYTTRQKATSTRCFVAAYKYMARRLSCVSCGRVSHSVA